MDEVRVGRLIDKWKSNGQLDTEDPLLVILKNWPNSRKYKGRPELLPGLEQQVLSDKIIIIIYIYIYIYFFFLFI